MIELKNSDKWFLATNAETIFTKPQKLERNIEMVTGQPYLLTADSVEQLIRKVYAEPILPYQGDESEVDLYGGYCMEQLNPKTKNQIKAAAD